jgi:hypothetical protein
MPGRKSWSWRSLLPDMSAAVTRFPLAVAIAALLTLYMLYDSRSGDTEQRIVEGLGASLAWVVAADLYVESQGHARLTRLLLWLAGLAVIALLFTFAWKLWLAPFLLSAALVFLIGLAGHPGARRAQRFFLAVQPSALAWGRYCAGRRRPAGVGPFRHRRDLEPAVRARTAWALTQRHLDRRARFRGAGELACVCAAELHRAAFASA